VLAIAAQNFKTNSRSRPVRRGRNKTASRLPSAGKGKAEDCFLLSTTTSQPRKS
jgi:hypothetical protein